MRAPLVAAAALALTACSHQAPASAPPPHPTATPAATRSVSAPPAPHRWTSGPALPVAVSEVGVAALGSVVHVVGGYTNGTAHSRTHLGFDTRTGTWHQLTPLPAALDHVGLVGVAGQVWAIGGYGAAAGGTVGVYSWRAGDSSWRRHADLPGPRAAGVALVLEGKIHYLGGKSHGRGTAEHDVYDPATDHWTTAAPLHLARDHAAGASISGRLYVSGGRPGDTTSTEVYDPRQDAWTPGPPLPLGRSSVAGANLDGRFLVIGGEHPKEQAVDAEVDAYDPGTGRWTRMADLPYGLQGIGACVINRRLYVPGGAPSGGGSEQSNRMLIFG